MDATHRDHTSPQSAISCIKAINSSKFTLFILIVKLQHEPAVVVHTSKPSTKEVETGSLRLAGQLGLPS